MTSVSVSGLTTVSVVDFPNANLKQNYPRPPIETLITLIRSQFLLFG